SDAKRRESIGELNVKAAEKALEEAKKAAEMRPMDKKAQEDLKNAQDVEKLAKEGQTKLKDEAEAAKKKADAKDFGDLRQRWEADGVYATDAYRLLLTYNNNICLSCHRVGALGVNPAQAPYLDKVSDRLRPQWTTEWIANPNRM